jgi:hypothetical protein
LEHRAGLCYSIAVVPTEQAYRRFQRSVDRLCFLIVSTDYPERDINIERLHLRTEAARLFPEKFHLYDMLYESRFRRLLSQFRGAK